MSDQLDPIVLKLGGDGRVNLVTGSLDTEDAAAVLTAKIMAYVR